MKYAFGLALALAVAPVTAEAQRRVNFEPINAPEGAARFNHGRVSVEVTSPGGAVQITPLGLEHNRLTFAVAVLNLGENAANFGTENISARVGTSDILVLSAERLRQQAERRAGWTAFAVAMAGGLSAAAAASSRDTYSATTYTPRGTYRTVISQPSVGGQVAAAGITAGTAYTIANIQQQLDQTVSMLGNEIVQTTTIDPQDSYAGRFVLATMPRGHTRWPQDVTLTVNYNGQEYPFTFRVTRAR